MKRAGPRALALLAALPAPAPAHQAKDDGRLNRIGPAPEFALTREDGRRLALCDLLRAISR